MTDQIVTLNGESYKIGLTEKKKKGGTGLIRYFECKVFNELDIMACSNFDILYDVKEKTLQAWTGNTCVETVINFRNKITSKIVIDF